MPDGINFDFTDLLKLEADLGLITEATTIHKVRQAVEVTARNVKNDWRDNAKASNPEHAKGYPYAIDYDLDLKKDGEISAEIGPKIGGQGSLGFLEEAPGGVRAAPQGNARRAVAKNIADFEEGILLATEGDL